MATSIITEFRIYQTSDIGDLGAIVVEFLPEFTVELNGKNVRYRSNYRQYSSFNEKTNKN